jgi:hypothetical protein
MNEELQTELYSAKSQHASTELDKVNKKLFLKSKVIQLFLTYLFFCSKKKCEEEF